MAGLGRTGAVSLRSQLLTGAAAVVTVTAVTVGGATANGVDLPSAQVPALANVELSAAANPLLEIYNTIQKANLYTFSIAEPPTTVFDRAGIIPDFLAAGFPILTQYFLNAPDYINQSINYLFNDYGQPGDPLQLPGALRALTWAVDALPANIAFALTNPSFAWATLEFAILNPIQYAFYQTLNAGLYTLGGVGQRAAAVITAVAEWVPTAIRSLADDVTIVFDSVVHVVGDVVYGIQTGSLERVWNALVVGLVGTLPAPFDTLSNTIPDALINQTIGAGSFVGAAMVEAPSIRQILTDLRDATAEALATDVPVPEPPPFNVAGPFGGISQIPTPWQPTPFFPSPPVAQVAAASVAASPSTAAPAVEAAPIIEDATATSRTDIPAVSVQVPGAVIADTAADAVRPARASRTAADRAADAGGPSARKPSTQVGARSAPR